MKKEQTSKEYKFPFPNVIIGIPKKILPNLRNKKIISSPGIADAQKCKKESFLME